MKRIEYYYLIQGSATNPRGLSSLFRSGQSQQLRPLLYVNVVVIDLNLTDGSIKSIGPQQHFLHRSVRQTLSSSVTVFCVYHDSHQSK
jgi:hypothetical protein